MKTLLLWATTLCVAGHLATAQPFHRVEELFPPEAVHNHSSSIVELPNGDLFVVWFHGSGERTADDVLVQGTRWVKSRGQWTPRRTLADMPGYPDCNSMVYVDKQKRLWLFWAQIIANQWETALTRYQRAGNYDDPDSPPKWDWAGAITIIPRNIAARTREVFPDNAAQIKLAEDKYASRMGWFTRTHPIELPSGRMLLPLYSDGYSYGIMAISDDQGATWYGSEPIVGAGGIQPSVVRKKDGTLVAYLRDNGPPPKRILMSTSKDDGVSWTAATDTDLPNPGSSIEAIALKSGEWLMVHNDTEKDRDSLRVALSDDEGRTWKWSRHLERKLNGRYHYPSVIQAADGSIHVTYSAFERNEKAEVKTIKHAHFNVDWVKQGETVAMGPWVKEGRYKHSASITQLPDGDLYMAFYTGESEYATNTSIWGSRLHAGVWSYPVRLASGKEPLGNPVVWTKGTDVNLDFVARLGDTWSTAVTRRIVSQDSSRTWGPVETVSSVPGTMVRNRPLRLANGEWLLPAYRETGTSGDFMPPDTSSIFIREDMSVSQPIRSKMGNLQPAVVELAPGHLVAYCRRAGGYGGGTQAFIVRAESKDGGRTWSQGTDTAFPNPNAAIDLLKLKSGRLLLIYNDSFDKRTPLVARFVEPAGPAFVIADGPHSYAYPYAIQAEDGKIHLVYSEDRSLIHHVVLDEAAIAGARQ